jgi:acetolactate synthase-1/2/3 large subunit
MSSQSLAVATQPQQAPLSLGPKKLTGAQIIWEVLTHMGIKTVFGYPGGAILPTYDAMMDYGIHHVLVRHEQGAGHMADGWARATGEVGVAIATSGPGATNLVTSIHTAMMDSVPVVFITGQVSSPLIGKDAFQETDIVGITMPVTKHNYLITRAEDIAQAIKEAFYIARSGRPGPVLVDITKDAQQATIDFTWTGPEVTLPGYRPVHEAPLEEYARAVDLIKKARRPVVLAGHGIVMSHAEKEVATFLERTETPAAMTLLGLGGLPASHPLNLGMMGMHGEAWVNKAIQEADLLLAFGMRFDDRVTGNLATYAPTARKIHIEIDPAEVHKNVKVDVGLVGDLKQVLTRLLSMVSDARHTEWINHITASRGDASVRDIKNLPDNGHLYAAHVIHDLYTLTEGKAVVVTDVGQHQMWEAQYYHHQRPRSLITSGGLGTMGFALPAAIGARFGRPDDEIWVIAGDGGFQMTACELATIKQEGIKLNIAIINNGYLGMVRQWQEFFYQRRYAATPIISPDFVKLADAHGLLGLRVTKRAELPDVVRRAREEKGTVVIDFRVEQEDSVYPMVPAGADLGDMIRRPSPIAETGQDR